MIAKIIATGPDRESARTTLAAALGAMVVQGVETNRLTLLRIIESSPFADGAYDTTFVDRNPDLIRSPQADEATTDLEAIAALIVFTDELRGSPAPLRSIPPGWRNVGPSFDHVRLTTGTATHALRYRYDAHGTGTVMVDGREHTTRIIELSAALLHLEIDGVRTAVSYSRSGDQVYLTTRCSDVSFRRQPRFSPPSAEMSRPGAIAPVPGLVVEVLVREGDRVEEGEIVVRLEAMKMLHEISSPFGGLVVEVLAIPGTTVDAHALLVVVEPDRAASGQPPSN
jgi:propionyl-CoA carboxylase alpha chain